MHLALFILDGTISNIFLEMGRFGLYLLIIGQFVYMKLIQILMRRNQAQF